MDVQSAVHSASHTMNKPTQKTLQTLTNKINKLVTTKAPRKLKKRGGIAGLARDPGMRGNNPLSLTRNQFTATSPLNLFNITRGTTPGGVRVSGRELIASVVIPLVANGGYTLATNFSTNLLAGAINPVTFPRLAAYAPIYEYFIFHKLTYFFQSNQPTTTAGAIILSIEYDGNDPAPASTSAQMRNISSTMANIYSDASLQGLKSLARIDRFVTNAPTAANILQSEQGVLYVAVEGYTNLAVSTVGYIIAEYDVEFFTPQ